MPSGPGGSTIATQLEKMRNSPGGRTDTPVEKLRQMVSASMRAYRDGPDTIEERRPLVVDVLNYTPLSGSTSHGEVIGLGAGLELGRSEVRRRPCKFVEIPVVAADRKAEQRL